MDQIEEAFKLYRTEIDSDAELKEEIRTITREWEKSNRDIMSFLQKAQRKPSAEQVKETCEQVTKLMPAVKQSFQDLAEKVPQNEFFRYHDLFRFMTTRMAFIAAFVHYLQTDSLISKEETAKRLGIECNPQGGFHLDLEDYLTGILDLAKELSRLAVNSVSIGDCARPFQIRDFLTDLDSGFRMLNLKNDGLRRRFDALKYDVKKSEEIVYDLTIRQLKDKKPEGDAVAASS